MSAELERRRRNVAVLDKLTASCVMLLHGDEAGSSRAADEALAIDADVVVAVTGGMVIGEVPRPDKDFDAWAEYVAVQRDALAQLEGEGG